MTAGGVDGDGDGSDCGDSDLQVRLVLLANVDVACVVGPHIGSLKAAAAILNTVNTAHSFTHSLTHSLTHSTLLERSVRQAVN